MLGILLTQVGYANGSYKYSRKPHLPITSGQTTLDAIYVPVNVKVSDVRVGIYAKTVMYSSLRITLTSPHGVQVVLKQESGNPGAAPVYGSLGSPRSLTLFQQGGNALSNVPPNDRPINPATPLALMNGELSQGWWVLNIVDERNFAANAQPQEGFLEEWTLMFNQQIKEPIQPFNPPINILFPGGASIRGQINGTTATFADPNRAQIPNERFGGLLCNPSPNDPNVVLGVNGDAFPVIISGHPGALIGTAANGYPAGRFRVTITVETNYAPGSPFLAGLTEDIAMYFGRVPTYTAPLPAPPSFGDPGFQAKNASGWPTGAGTVNTLQGGTSGLYGGVRLAACLTPQPGVDDYGYDRVTFDDFAFDQIASNLPPGPSGGFYGTYKPEQPFSSLNGLPVDGLYYVTVYDAFGDNQNAYGHIRVTYLNVEYIVGGGEISDPIRHQGVAGPLLGVPIPGAFTGAPLGYLSDVVGVIPPYGENAKEQDPIMVFWATQKLYPKDATGTERIQAVDQSNYAPPSATHYHGPYAYPGSLDANPLVAGALVNADLLIVPEGNYNLRVNLTQPRYDDDLADNQMESADINVNPISLSYHGEQIPLWNKFVDPAQANTVASGTIGPNIGIAQTFVLFKNPYTTVTSVDYKFDKGTVVTPRATTRMSLWKVNGISGFTGAPATLVARSTNVTLNEYIEGNWRTFPLYPVTAGGAPDLNLGGSVDLTPGTYAVTLENVDPVNNIIIYPYTYAAIPSLKDRHWNYLFGDNFGPLGPFSTLGTRMTYASLNVSNPPAAAWGTLGGRNLSNHAFPLRLNMATLNDFGINYVRWSSQTSPTEDIAVGQAVTPYVNVTAYSDQGGLTKGFNVYLAVYDPGNNLLYSDMVNVDNAPYNGIQGYQTLSVEMDEWTPTTGGNYKVRVWFTRNPDDQNPINDKLEYDLEVIAQPVIAYDNNTDRALIDRTAERVGRHGLDPVFVNMSTAKLSAYKNSTVFFLGTMTSDAKLELQSAVANGNNVAFVFDRNDRIGYTVEKIDGLYGIERAGNVDYANVELAASFRHNGEIEETVTPIDLPKFTSKEELLKYIASHDMTLKEPTQSMKKYDGYDAYQSVIPVETGSKFGTITYVSDLSGDLGIVYTVPSNRKGGSTRTDQSAPVAFSLEQNYPNPFNPTTAISYTLPEASVVTLRVLDLLGREVATLVSATQNAGTYNVGFSGLDQNGKDLTSGTYLYRIDATPVKGGATFSSTKKMLLSK
ncbi:MAG TPA: FlgD immunoglobulin-like domain containing protein [Bacteroidota bacterium]|nr:FlgD immunoglobulin-like domain containing protein [Bacteroidota bacterium]